MELLKLLGAIAVGVTLCYLFKTAIDDLRFRKQSTNKKDKSEKNPEPFVEVSVKDMDKHYDRSAGRWCDACKTHGSHHTDMHNEFAKNLTKVNS